MSFVVWLRSMIDENRRADDEVRRRQLEAAQSAAAAALQTEQHRAAAELAEVRRYMCDRGERLPSLSWAMTRWHLSSEKGGNDVMIFVFSGGKSPR